MPFTSPSTQHVQALGTPPTSKNHHVMAIDWIETPLGMMIAIADTRALYLLEFTNRKGLDREINRFHQDLNAAMIPGKTALTQRIKTELAAYFLGSLTHFKTPLVHVGSAFQIIVWKALQKIAYGSTRSYLQLAVSINKPTAVRAVANAIGANPLALMIPCHRIIGSDGRLTGYAGGITRKKWLITHEKEREI